MRVMIGFKAEQEFKAFLQKLAEKENRSLSGFIINALITYVKEHHKIDWQEIKTPPKKP
jgi:predicted transcriptional regulator